MQQHLLRDPLGRTLFAAVMASSLVAGSLRFVFVYVVGSQQGAAPALAWGASSLLLPALIGSWLSNQLLQLGSSRAGLLTGIMSLLGPLALLALPRTDPGWLTAVVLWSAVAATVVRGLAVQVSARLFPQGVAQANGIIVSGWQMTMFAATPLGGLLYSGWGVRGAAGACTLLAALGALAGWRLLRALNPRHRDLPTSQLRRGWQLLRPAGGLRRSAVLLAAWNLAAGVAVPPLLYLAAVEQASSLTVTAVTAVAGLGPLLAAGWLGARGSRERRLGWLLLAQAVALAGLPWCAAQPLAVATLALLGATANALVAGTLRGASARRSQTEDQNPVFALTTMLAAVGLASGSLLGAGICALAAPAWACWVAAAGALGLMLAGRGLHRLD